MKTVFLVTAAAAALSGCASMDKTTDTEAAVAIATIRDAGGGELGSARVMNASGGLRVTVSGAGMAPGTHGLHIHSVGRCDAPAFTTAGDHWNPDMKQHGRNNPAGAHRGDLPNLFIGADGRGTVSFAIGGTSAALFDADGASIVVHAAADDNTTDPSGNSGARIACGVFAPA